jgi:hypothetical protein
MWVTAVLDGKRLANGKDWRHLLEIKENLAGVKGAFI